MPSAPKQAKRSATLGPYGGPLSDLVKRLQDEPFLFVIAIAILLIGLTALGSALGSSDLRFIVLVIAFLALTVIIVYFIGKFILRQALQDSEIRAIQIALKGILTKHEIGPLMGLNGPNPYMMHYEPDLYGYLHRLDGLNFIQPNEGYGLYDIVKDHPREFDLKKYIYITN